MKRIFSGQDRRSSRKSRPPQALQYFTYDDVVAAAEPTVGTYPRHGDAVSDGAAAVEPVAATRASTTRTGRRTRDNSVSQQDTVSTPGPKQIKSDPRRRRSSKPEPLQYFTYDDVQAKDMPSFGGFPLRGDGEAPSPLSSATKGKERRIGSTILPASPAIPQGRSQMGTSDLNGLSRNEALDGVPDANVPSSSAFRGGHHHTSSATRSPTLHEPRMSSAAGDRIDVVEMPLASHRAVPVIIQRGGEPTASASVAYTFAAPLNLPKSRNGRPRRPDASEALRPGTFRESVGASRVPPKAVPSPVTAPEIPNVQEASPSTSADKSMLSHHVQAGLPPVARARAQEPSPADDPINIEPLSFHQPAASGPFPESYLARGQASAANGASSTVDPSDHTRPVTGAVHPTAQMSARSNSALVGAPRSSSTRAALSTPSAVTNPARSGTSRQTPSTSQYPVPSVHEVVRRANFDSADTSIEEVIAPAVTHETVTTHVHHVREERITREIHTYDVFHRIQPVIDVEVLATRHFLAVEGGGLVEVDASQVPGRARNWVIAETVSRGDPSQAGGELKRRAFSARTFEGTEGDDRRFMSPEGYPVTEQTWVHPPELETGAQLSGQTRPIHFNHVYHDPETGEVVPPPTGELIPDHFHPAGPAGHRAA